MDTTRPRKVYSEQLSQAMIARGDSSVFQPRGHPELRTIVGAIGPDPRSRHVPAGVDRRPHRALGRPAWTASLMSCQICGLL